MTNHPWLSDSPCRSHSDLLSNSMIGLKENSPQLLSFCHVALPMASPDLAGRLGYEDVQLELRGKLMKHNTEPMAMGCALGCSASSCGSPLCSRQS